MTAPDPSAPASGTGSLATTTTRSAYDAAGRLCRVLENATVDLAALADPCTDATVPAGTTTTNVSTRYTYDPAGRLASMIDGRGNTTAYGYDAAGRMTGLTDALDETLAWGYDDGADTKTQTNRTDPTPGTPTITWTSDAAGRLVSRAYLDEAGGARTTTYTYDAAGALASATDAAGTITITNDRLGRPVSVTVSGDTGATTTYAYSFTAPTRTDAAGITTMAVDPFGRVTSLAPPGFGAFTTTWGADGQPTGAAAPNCNTTAYGYDALGRLLTMTTGTRAAYAYTLNRAGSRMSEASTISGDPGNGTATFGYDPLGRLTSHALPGIRTLGAAWQQVPNRSSLTTDGTPATQAFDAANRPTGSGYAFDVDGRMTDRPGASGTALEWDSLGRLARVRATPGGTILATYSYDALDRLVLADRGAAGRLRFRYAGTTPALTGIVDDATGTVLRHVVPGADGTVLADRSGAGTDPRTYGTNAHHDVTWVADATGAVIATARSDPWGTILRSSGTLPAWRFQGSWHDSVTDLAYARARWYSSALGSFISEDTLLGAPETPASRHLLAYSLGDPVNGWDPEGRWWHRVRAGETLRTMARKYTRGNVDLLYWPNRSILYYRVCPNLCMWVPTRPAYPGQVDDPRSLAKCIAMARQPIVCTVSGRGIVGGGVELFGGGVMMVLGGAVAAIGVGIGFEPHLLIPSFGLSIFEGLEIAGFGAVAIGFGGGMVVDGLRRIGASVRCRR